MSISDTDRGGMSRDSVAERLRARERVLLISKTCLGVCTCVFCAAGDMRLLRVHVRHRPLHSCVSGDRNAHNSMLVFNAHAPLCVCMYTHAHICVYSGSCARTHTCVYTQVHVHARAGGAFFPLPQPHRDLRGARHRSCALPLALPDMRECVHVSLQICVSACTCACMW